jgi:hypothetical protein
MTLSVSLTDSARQMKQEEMQLAETYSSYLEGRPTYLPRNMEGKNAWTANSCSDSQRLLRTFQDSKFIKVLGS